MEFAKCVTITVINVIVNAAAKTAILTYGHLKRLRVAPIA